MSTFKYNESPYSKIPEELVNDFTMNRIVCYLSWNLTSNSDENTRIH